MFRSAGLWLADGPQLVLWIQYLLCSPFMDHGYEYKHHVWSVTWSSFSLWPETDRKWMTSQTSSVLITNCTPVILVTCLTPSPVNWRRETRACKVQHCMGYGLSLFGVCPMQDSAQKDRERGCCGGAAYSCIFTRPSVSALCHFLCLSTRASVLLLLSCHSAEMKPFLLAGTNYE